MPEPSEKEQKEAAEALANYVVERMKAGAASSAIVTELVGKGMEQEPALALVGSVHAQIEAMRAEENYSSAVLVPAAGAAVGAAVVAALVWAVITVVTDYEIGWIAWGLGALCGYGAYLGAGKKRGRPLQLAAVGASLFGLLIAKYFIFYHFVKKAVEEEQGAEIAAQFSVLSEPIAAAFVGALPEMATPFDLLWIFLAVSTAWSIPKPVGIAPKA